MILASQIINIVVAGGMVVGLLLIVGVAGALIGTRKGGRSTPAFNDPAVAELDDRLRKLTLASPFAEDPSAKRDSIAAEAPGDRHMPGLIRPVMETEPARPSLLAPEGGRVIEPPSSPRDPFGGAGRSAGVDSIPVGGRPALPGDALGRPFSAQPTAVPRGQALDPLAARFSGSQRLTDAAPLAPPISDFGGAGQRRELPGTVAGDQSKSEHGFSGSEVRAPAADRFGFSAGSPSDLPPVTEQRGAPANSVPDPFASRTGGTASTGSPRRHELPGAVAGRPGTAGQNAPALDIRAILRGEVVPRGALPPSGSIGADPAANAFKPNLNTGPLPAVVLAGPVGAVRFDAGLLELRVLKPDPDAGSSRLHVQGVSGQQRPGAGESGSSAAKIDFDAGKLMDDFDLPDAGFETHVFSTAELVDDEAVPSSPIARMSSPGGSSPTTFSIPITEYQTDPASDRGSRLDSAPFGDYQSSEDQELGTSPLADLTYLTPGQEGRARQELEDIAQLSDVLFAKLMAADGSVMLEAGAEGGDSRTNRNLAALIAVVGLEVDRCALGSASGITLESPEGALVCSPLCNGAVLAVLLGNPARLGMLRRQIKRPVGSLRSLLMESSVS
ncbi:MAG: hypothetical protein ACRDIE_19990 [Chloroflexota bacterium]